jgi:hypothetical protein
VLQVTLPPLLQLRPLRHQSLAIRDLGRATGVIVEFVGRRVDAGESISLHTLAVDAIHLGRGGVVDTRCGLESGRMADVHSHRLVIRRRVVVTLRLVHVLVIRRFVVAADLESFLASHPPSSTPNLAWIVARFPGSAARSRDVELEGPSPEEVEAMVDEWHRAPIENATVVGALARKYRYVRGKWLLYANREFVYFNCRRRSRGSHDSPRCR